MLNLCRICEKQSHLIDLQTHPNYTEQYLIVGNVTYDTFDELPQFLCRFCITQLLHFVKFKQKCEETYRKFQNELRMETSVEFKTGINEIDVYQNSSNYEIDNSENIIKTELTINDSNWQENMESNGNDDDNISLLTVLSYDSDNENSGNVVQKTNEFHSRTDIVEKPYKCELCDNCYTEKRHLAAHIKTHTISQSYDEITNTSSISKLVHHPENSTVTLSNSKTTPPNASTTLSTSTHLKTLATTSSLRSAKHQKSTIPSSIVKQSKTVFSDGDKSKVFDLADVGTWPWPFPNSMVQEIIEFGPNQVKDIVFPTKKSRKFSEKYYLRVMSNNEVIPRLWLVYSIKKDAVYCFCCKIFSQEEMCLTSGFSDWNHLNRQQKEHELSMAHMTHFKSWKDFERNLKGNPIIDNNVEKRYEKETEHWRTFLKHLIKLVQFLATQNLIFQGNGDKFYEPNNGANFFKLVEHVAEIDPILKEYLRRFPSNETQKTYLNDSIQNELIRIISETVRANISESIKKSKYFSIIIDCTADMNHQEQLSLVVRIVERQNNSFQIKDYFLGFLAATGEQDVTKLVLKELEKFNIPLSNLRAKGYNNAENIRGKNCAMQNSLNQLEPRAFFVPCMAHSLNLIVTNAAKSSLEAAAFFDTVQSVYGFLSGSVSRWNILKKHINELTLEPLNDNRWASRLDALQPFVNQLSDIKKALIEVANSFTSDAFAKDLALALSRKICDYKFVCCLLVWYDILSKISATSKYFQGDQININSASKMLESSTNFLKALRNNDEFSNYLIKANFIAINNNIKAGFSPSYNKKSQQMLENKFKIDFFSSTLDAVIDSIEERLLLLKSHENNFDFLYNISDLKDMQSGLLRRKCKHLAEILTYKTESDVNGIELLRELKMLSTLVSADSTPIDVLDYVYANNLETAFPNAINALNVLLIQPVTATVSGGKRNFSKLKMIETYLMSTTEQTRLLDLAIISIEKDIVYQCNYMEMIQNFAIKMARKVSFKYSAKNVNF